MSNGISLRATVHCPYCNSEVRFVVQQEDLTRRRLIYCDMEEGGCDKDFAIGPVKLTAETLVSALVEDLK